MTRPTSKIDATAFYGAFTAGELKKAIADAALPFLGRYNVCVEVADKPPTADKVEAFNGRILAKTLRYTFKTMAGFGANIAQVALTSAATLHYCKAVVYDIKLAMEYQSGAAYAVFSYKVALLKE